MPTLPEALDTAAAAPGAYCFVAGDGRERVVSFAALRGEALTLGGALRARGLRSGDPVAIIIPEPESFLTVFFGAAVAGLVPTPLPPPLHAGELAPYLSRIVSLVRASGARAVVTTPLLRPLLGRVHAAARAVRFVATWSELAGPPLPRSEPVALDAPALLQFTSGATSEPKGVVLTHANLGANVHALGGPDGLALGPGDTGVSWLPLFHDMGLIGAALSPVYYGRYGRRGVFLSPVTFLQRPVEWLRAITRHRGTVSFAPNFAYAMCVRRVKDAELGGLDLTSWRVAGCGAEPIEVDTLEAFAARFAPVGFRATSYVAAYGLAEHTLAVALAPRDRGLRVDFVRTTGLLERGRAEPCPPDDPDAARLVACGRAFPGHSLRIVDDLGHALGEQSVGEIVVTGPSVMRGYLRGSGATAEPIRDGWLWTGDVGYLHQGELFVCGRRKEMIVVNGRNYFPQDLESAAHRVPGVRPGRVAAFAATRPGQPDRVVVVVEALGTVPHAALEAQVRRRVLEATGLAVDEVAVVPRGTIGRTTSGKVRRSELRERCLAGRPLAPAARPFRRRLLQHLVVSQLGYLTAFLRQLRTRVSHLGSQESA